MTTQDSLRPRRGLGLPTTTTSDDRDEGQPVATTPRRLLRRLRHRLPLSSIQTVIGGLVILSLFTMYSLVDLIDITDEKIDKSSASMVKSNDLIDLIDLIDHTSFEQAPFGFSNNLPLRKDEIISKFDLQQKGFNRIVAIGDLHGDLSQLRNILIRTKVIDSDDNWVASKGTVLVQTGDIFDRGHQSVDILKFFWKLRQLAIKPDKNGLVLQILGNHEHMNLVGDYRYVNANELGAFGGNKNWDTMLSLDNPVGWYLRQLPIIRIVGSTLFTHAGLRPQILTYFNNNISRINEIMHVSLNSVEFDEYSHEKLFYDSLAITGNNGPIWTREFEPRFYDSRKIRSIAPDGMKDGKDRRQLIQEFMCDQVEETLSILNVKRMVIGHNVQSTGRVTNHCEGKLFSIDVGMSYAYGGSLGAIEIDIENEIVSIVE